MIDTTQIRQNTDLLVLIGRDTQLKRVASTNGGEWAGPCPFCGGRDRFRVWPNNDPPRWWCRQCNRNGDVITYVMQRDGLNFRATCERLGAVNATRRPKLKPEIDQGPPSGTWQSRGREFVAYAQDRLWDRIGARALVWLQGRGLHTETIRYFGLGYNPADLQTSLIGGA